MACQYSHTVSDNMSIETFPVVRLSESHQVASPPADWTQTPDRQLLAFMLGRCVFVSRSVTLSLWSRQSAKRENSDQTFASSDICSIFCKMAETFCSASTFCCMVSATILGGALSMNFLLFILPRTPARSFSSFSRCLLRRATSLFTSNRPAKHIQPSKLCPFITDVSFLCLLISYMYPGLCTSQALHRRAGHPWHAQDSPVCFPALHSRACLAHKRVWQQDL